MPEFRLPDVSRRTVLAGGAGAVAAGLVPAFDAPTAAAAPARSRRLSLLIDNAPAKVGTYSFPDEVTSFTLDNGLVRFVFGRDDGPSGTRPQGSVSVNVWSVTVDGTELAPDDPFANKSFYVDSWGGKARLVCSEIRVLRLEGDLIDVAIVDTISPKLQHEHHLILREGVRGLYGYNIMTAVVDTQINEVRMNTRWNRGIFDHTYNVERGIGRQPTYAYLKTQTRIQDETWQVNGVNDPNLPYPTTNAGGLKPGDIYSKYDWSLYHHENPMFGHLGNGFGVWFTSLGGVTGDTLCATYGVGPQHQDLAVHQDVIILNYMGANHYGLPAYTIPAGYRRLYGPWLTFINTGSDLESIVADAKRVAEDQIRANRSGAGWVADRLYPPRERRHTVRGRLALGDGRPSGGFWVVLSTQTADDVYSIHEPTYFVRTDSQGRFELPGIPPAWKPGTTDPGSYTLYVFAAEGSVTDQYVRTGVVVDSDVDLGTIHWTPPARGTFLWQLGSASRTSGEYALASLSPVRPEVRGYKKPSRIPADLTFRIGRDWEPVDWYYAQTNPGDWTIAFSLTRQYSGTARLTVSTSMQQSGAPSVSVNGQTAVVSGEIPDNNDSTIARQADRSGYPRLVELTFPASALTVGENTVTFHHGPAANNGKGPGWDTILLDVDEGGSPTPGEARVTASRTLRGPQQRVTVSVTNTGSTELRDLRLAAVEFTDGASTHDVAAPVVGRDPAAHPVPLAESLAAGETRQFQIDVASRRSVGVTVAADGGRVPSTVRVA
ncbi:MAG TPA: polysaccharide lyase family protein [Propionibacteriaceae bacterium]|nr:polysaccharide lyase family protein [Propionibacteriaceae bacterium]